MNYYDKEKQSTISSDQFLAVLKKKLKKWNLFYLYLI